VQALKLVLVLLAVTAALHLLTERPVVPTPVLLVLVGGHEWSSDPGSLPM